MVVHRHELRPALSKLVHLVMKRSRPRSRPVAVPPVVTATATRVLPEAIVGSKAAE
jgi:hypothetical protein